MGLARTLGAFMAAAQLTLPDRRAMALFDLSETGFWRSFQALLWYVGALAAANFVTAGSTADTAHVVADAAFDVVNFLAFPLLMIPVSRSLGIGDRYVPLVVATNWASALAAIAVSLLAMGPALPQLIWDLTVLALLLYRWNTIRIAAGTGGLMAAGLAALDVVATLILYQLRTLVGG